MVARQRQGARVVCVAAALALSVCASVLWSGPADAIAVDDEATFRAAWSNPAETQIDLAADVTLTCDGGVAQRDSATALTLDGHGHSITQTCANGLALMVLDDASHSGTSPVTFRNVRIHSGDSTHSVLLTNSAVAGSAASNTGSRMSQVISVRVRRRHHPRRNDPRRHQPRPAPDAPDPAGSVQAVVRFTG